MPELLQARRAYGHRLRDQVCQNGTLAQLREFKIPRSTVASWRSRGPRSVVTIEQFGQGLQQLLDRIEKLTRREQVLAAVVRLLFALLRISGFRLCGERLPAGNDKVRMLRAIAGAEPVLSHVRGDSHNKGYGARPRLASHALAHAQPLRSAGGQGLRVRHHLGSPRA